MPTASCRTRFTWRTSRGRFLSSMIRTTQARPDTPLCDLLRFNNQESATHATCLPARSLQRLEAGRSMFEVEAEARAMLAGLKDLARRQSVQFELAVEPGLAIDGDVHALRAVLTELTAHAARRAAGGRVLLAASRVGRFAEIAVCDDGR